MERCRARRIDLDIEHGDSYTSIMIEEGQGVLVEPRRPTDSPVPDAQVIIEEARQHKQRRQRRVLVLVTVAVAFLGGLALIGAALASRTSQPAGSALPIPPSAPLVNSRTPLILDLFFGVPIGEGPYKNVAVNLQTGTVRTIDNLGPVYGIARNGYLLGFNNNAVSAFSYDLGHTISTWTGSYGRNPVPANNSTDVWVSSSAGTATEVNQYERPVAPTVTIPQGSVVEGQVGPNLLLMAGNPPTLSLELWSPTQQRVFATLGSEMFSLSS